MKGLTAKLDVAVQAGEPMAVNDEGALSSFEDRAFLLKCIVEPRTQAFADAVGDFDEFGTVADIEGAFPR